MKGKLVIGRVGQCWAVFRDGTRVSGLQNTVGEAELRRDNMQRAAQRKPRSCICCGERFVSDGPHNRMCSHCRRRDPEPDLAFAGADAWPKGRRGLT